MWYPHARRTEWEITRHDDDEPLARAQRNAICRSRSRTAIDRYIENEVVFTGDPDKSGIYIPSWVGGPGGFAEPNYVDPTGKKYFFLHYRFRNRAEGMNVGLIIDKFSRYPMSPAYVMTALAAEAQSMLQN